MKKLIAVLAIGLTMMSMSLTADAARRFGGGASFGRSAPTLQRAAPAPQKPTLNQQANPAQQRQQQAAPNQARPSQPAPAASPWRGMLMGAAAALGITALAHALGLGEGFVNFLMMLLVAFVAYYAIRFILGMFLVKRTAGMGGVSPQTEAQARQRQEASQSYRTSTQQASEPSTSAYQGAMAGSLLDELNNNSQAKAVPLPRDFDVEGFLRVAEENFVKMQKAWDTGNVTALSDFTTDEVFLEVTQQLRQRGNQDYTTEVISLKSEFRGIIEDGEDYLAGVTFTGTLNVSGEAEDVNETWILSKPIKGDRGWLLSGIHQEEN